MAEIGSTLREARMRARIDITEVEAHTKIRAKYLRAIENEEWDLLPGSVYVKSFLRTYGDFLGLDSRLLIDEFKRRYERPDDHEVRPMASRGRDRERANRRRSGVSFPPWVVIGVALVVIIAALGVLGSHTGGSTPSTSAITPPNAGHHKKGSSKTGNGSTTATGPATTTTQTQTTPVAPAKATLAMVATGSVWVCVKESTGKLLIPGLIYDTTGPKIPTETASHLLVNLGNSHVTVTINGKPFPIAASADPIGLDVTAKGATRLTTAPTCA